MSQAEIVAVNRRFEDAAAKGDVDAIAALYTTMRSLFRPTGHSSEAATVSSRCGPPWRNNSG